MSEQVKESQNYWTVFTDGSCKPNPGIGGFGWIIGSADGVIEGGGREEDTTNNRMELTAAIAALSYIRQKPGRIKIYADSKYLIDGISKWVEGWKRNNWRLKKNKPVLNQDLWQALDSLVTARQNSGYSIEWVHVSAHRGVAGNERADEIATAFALEKEHTLAAVMRDQYEIDLNDLSEHPESASPKVALAHPDLPMV